MLLFLQKSLKQDVFSRTPLTPGMVNWCYVGKGFHGQICNFKNFIYQLLLSTCWTSKAKLRAVSTPSHSTSQQAHEEGTVSHHFTEGLTFTQPVNNTHIDLDIKAHALTHCLNVPLQDLTAGLTRTSSGLGSYGGPRQDHGMQHLPKWFPHLHSSPSNPPVLAEHTFQNWV